MWVVTSRILVIFCGCCLLILSLINLYFFVIVQKKYKVPTILLFYIVAILLITCTVTYTWTEPIKDYCKIGWVLSFYGESFLNLIMGIV